MYREDLCGGGISEGFNKEDCYSEFMNILRNQEMDNSHENLHHIVLQIGSLLILCIMTALGFFLLRSKPLKMHPYNLYGFEALACVNFLFYWYVWYYIVRLADLFVYLHPYFFTERKQEKTLRLAVAF